MNYLNQSTKSADEGGYMGHVITSVAYLVRDSATILVSSMPKWIPHLDIGKPRGNIYSRNEDGVIYSEEHDSRIEASDASIEANLA